MWVPAALKAETKRAKVLEGLKLIEPDGDLDGSYKITTLGIELCEKRKCCGRKNVRVGCATDSVGVGNAIFPDGGETG